MKSSTTLLLAFQCTRLLCADPSDAAKIFLCYIYGRETPEISKICHVNEDIWMLKGAPNPVKQWAVHIEPITIESTGVFMGVIENDICVVELRDGKVDPEFNLQSVYATHQQIIRRFLYSALLQDKVKLAILTTHPENISFGGAPKAYYGEMGQYSDVIKAIPIIRVSSKESDAKTQSVTNRLPLGKNGFNEK